MKDKHIELVDFNGAPRVNRFYGGNAGRKICIDYQGEPWMLKYPESTANLQGRIASYTNSPVSEYLGSHVYALAGIPVHETLLGFRDGKVVVACKDFTYPDKALLEFKMLRNSISDDAGSFSSRPSDGTNVTLSDVLESINQLDNVYDAELLRNRFWDMFVVDALIGNKDRNNGNWGLLARNGVIEGLAPVYDNGNSFFNKRTPTLNAERLADPDLLEQDAIGTLTSVYTRDDGRHIKPLEYIGSGLDADCNAAIIRLADNLVFDKVLDLIESLPCEVLNLTVVGPETKEHMKATLLERWTKGILPAAKKAQG